jgi:spore maturation protein CgeB
MRILFFESNPMWIHGLPNGFQELGHEVKIASVTKENIRKYLYGFKPHLIITLGWTREAHLKQQDLLRKYIKRVPLVFWATEDPTHTATFTLPYILRVQPDFIFTICAHRAQTYQDLGFKAAHMDFGYAPQVQYRTEPIDEYRCSIAVVANAYPHILAKYPKHYRLQSIKLLLEPLLRENIRIDFWGKNWEGMSHILGRDLPSEWIHGFLPYTEANKVYSSADIVLGLQNNPTQMTQRVYEILGSEGFLCTIETPETKRLFAAGQDLITSTSPEQTVNQIRYYLEHPEEREKIRRQGKIAVQLHSYKKRAEYMLEVLKDQNIIGG